MNCYCITNPTEIQESLEANFIYPNIPFKNFYAFAGWKKKLFDKKYSRNQYKDQTRHFSDVTLTKTS